MALSFYVDCCRKFRTAPLSSFECFFMNQGFSAIHANCSKREYLGCPGSLQPTGKFHHRQRWVEGSASAFPLRPIHGKRKLKSLVQCLLFQPLSTFSRDQLKRAATLTKLDLVQLGKCRRPHNRLGFAYQVAFVRLFDRFPQGKA